MISCMVGVAPTRSLGGLLHGHWTGLWVAGLAVCSPWLKGARTEPRAVSCSTNKIDICRLGFGGMVGHVSSRSLAGLDWSLTMAVWDGVDYRSLQAFLWHRHKYLLHGPCTGRNTHRPRLGLARTNYRALSVFLRVQTRVSATGSMGQQSYSGTLAGRG